MKALKRMVVLAVGLGLLAVAPLRAQTRDRSPDAGLSITTKPAAQPLRSFLNRDVWPGYYNYGGQAYSPTTVSVRSQELYDRLGTHLLRGYPLISWRETRSDSLGLQKSSLSRENYLFDFFSQLVVNNDTYRGWDFSITAGDNIRTSLTPLTLRTPRWQGVRLDAQTQRQGFTLLLTRGAAGRFSAFDARLDRSPILAYGGHYNYKVNEVLSLGGTFFNQHQVDVGSQQGSFTSGTQPYQIQVPKRVVVRLESDGIEGATVAGVYGIIAEMRVKDPVEGRRTLRLESPVPSGGRRVGDLYQADTPGAAIDFVFDVPPDLEVLSMVFRADVAGDYRLSVRQVHDFTFVDGDELTTQERAWPAAPVHTRGGSLYPIDFKPNTPVEPFYTVARAEGRPGLGRRRTVSFQHGIPSGKTLLGTDFSIVARELMANGEIVYNIEESHFPFSNDSLDVRGKRFTKGAWAYTLNVRRPFSLKGLAAEIGGELFRMDPDYSGGYDSRRGGTVFFTDQGGPSGTEAFTQEFPLVEDNDDGDRYPDDSFEDGGRFAKQLVGNFGATPWAGVFPGLDSDGDQSPDNDKDRNAIPDWTEPFLHLDSDPADFVYGIDFNNNAQPDFRENDDHADYPIRKDQRGIHAFTGLTRSRPWLERLSVGYYRTEEIAGGGQSKSLYARLQAEWRPWRGMAVEAHDDVKLVEDDIRDDVYVWLIGDTELLGPNTNSPLNPPPADPLVMRKSLVNTAFVRAHYQPQNDLWLRLDLLHFYNGQRRLSENGNLIQSDKAYGEFSAVGRGSYHYERGRWEGWAGAKLALKNGRRGPAWPKQESRFFGPVLRTSYRIMEGMSLQWGMSGFPLVPLRFSDGQDPSRDYDERKMVFMLNGRSEDYQGSVVNISTGIELYHRDYVRGGPERDFDTFGIFLDLIIGN
jgi:hypothetical protein